MQHCRHGALSDEEKCYAVTIPQGATPSRLRRQRISPSKCGGKTLWADGQVWGRERKALQFHSLFGHW